MTRMYARRYPPGDVSDLRTPPAPRVLIVDAANVVGSRPDGWWRDRAGAAARLCEQLRRAVADAVLTGPVVVVLEGAARAGVTADDAGAVRVVHAGGSGDDCVVRLAEQSGHEGVTVVSADRALGERVQRLGADVVGPRWLLDQLKGTTE